MKIKAIIVDFGSTLISTSGFAFINMNKATKLFKLRKMLT